MHCPYQSDRFADWKQHEETHSQKRWQCLEAAIQIPSEKDDDIDEDNEDKNDNKSLDPSFRSGDHQNIERQGSPHCEPLSRAPSYPPSSKLKNQASILCDRPGCISGPFGSASDLKRHQLSTHAVPIYCDKPGCIGRQKLNRRDKRAAHNYYYHGPLQCRFEGCPRRHREDVFYGFSTEDDLAAHLREKHDASKN